MRRPAPGPALAVALLACLASPGSARQSNPQPVLVVEGRVVEEVSGAPIVGAQIDHLSPFRSTSAVTDSTGWYRIEFRSGETFLLFSAVRSGFLPEARVQQLPCDHYVVLPGELPTCRVEFHFEMRRFELRASGSPTCTIRGIVVYRDSGSPAEHASIRVDGTDIRALADRDGAFVLPEVPAGLHRVTARSSSTFPLSRLVVARCASPRDGPTLPLQLNASWIP